MARYELRVTRPTGVTTPVALPAVLQFGVTLVSDSGNGGVLKAGNLIEMNVYSSMPPSADGREQTYVTGAFKS